MGPAIGWVGPGLRLGMVDTHPHACMCGKDLAQGQRGGSKGLGGPDGSCLGVHVSGAVAASSWQRQRRAVRWVLGRF